VTLRRAILLRPRPGERASLSLTQQTVRSEDVYSRYESFREAARNTCPYIQLPVQLRVFLRRYLPAEYRFFGVINNRCDERRDLTRRLLSGFNSRLFILQKRPSISLTASFLLYFDFNRYLLILLRLRLNFILSFLTHYSLFYP